MGINQQEKKNQKPQKPSKPKKETGGWTGKNYRFLRLEITEAEKADFLEDYLPSADPLGVLTELHVPGYKVAVSYGNEGRTSVVSYSCSDEDDPNFGLTITTRAGDVSTALALLGYKIFILIDERTWTEAEYDRGGSYQTLG